MSPVPELASKINVFADRVDLLYPGQDLECQPACQDLFYSYLEAKPDL